MTIPKNDDSDSSPISEQDILQSLLPRNSRKDPTALPVTRDYLDSDISKTSTKHKILPWHAFAISVGIFIANKAIQSVIGFTQDTNNIVDIVVVIGIIAILSIYTRYYFGGKNG